MTFLNVVVCYNNVAEVKKYISQLLNVESERLFFSVTINSQNGHEYKELADFSKDYQNKVFIFDPHENLGYLNGMLYAYNEYIESNQKPDYVILSNTDIEIKDTCFFDKIEKAKYSSEIGCIGPSIYVPYRNVYDNPVSVERREKKKVDRLIQIMSIPILRGLYVGLSDIKGKLTRKNKTESGYVYEVHGSFFILSQRFIDTIANRKYGALMYSEEAYVAENIIKQGMKTYYDANIEVNHLEHSITKSLQLERVAKYIRDSMKVIREEFY